MNPCHVEFSLCPKFLPSFYPITIVASVLNLEKGNAKKYFQKTEKIYLIVQAVSGPPPCFRIGHYTTLEFLNTQASFQVALHDGGVLCVKIHAP